MKNPDIFISETEKIFNSSDIQKNFYELTDGRIIERLTLPIFTDNQKIGRLCNFRDITERKKLELSLLESELQQQALLDNMPFLAWLKDTDGKFIKINEPFAKACCKKTEDIISKTDFEIWTEDMAVLYTDDDIEVMESGKQKSVEEVVFTNEGERWYETFKTPIFNEDGKISGTAGLSREITDRNKNERELIQKDKLLTAAAESINELIRNQNFDEAVIKAFTLLGNTLKVDRVYLFQNHYDYKNNSKTTSQKYEWTSGFVNAQINNPERQNLPFESINFIIETLAQNIPIIGLAKNLDDKIKKIPGTEDIMSIILLPVLLKDDLWGFIGFDECKTERIFSEPEKAILLSFAASIAGVIEKNIQKEKEKDTLKQELNLALKHASLGLWYWNVQTGYVEFSDSLVKMLEYSVDEVEPAISSWESWLFEEDKQKASRVLKDYLDGNAEKYELECRVKTKSGDIKWILDQGEIIERDNEGKPLIMTGTHIDITERKKMQELILQTEKMVSVGELAAGMAHEINNPLGGIILGCQNIKRRISPDIEKNLEIAAEIDIDLIKLNEYLEKRELTGVINNIQSLGERASRIINEMLRFSRKNSILVEDIDITALIDKSIEFVSSEYNPKKKFNFKQINIVKEYTDRTVIKGKYVELEQVFVNLLQNASQAMQENNSEPKIIIRSYINNDFIVIEIEDNGSGMDENTIKRAFDPFYTTKEVGVGTGLGLSIAYFIITNAHNGTITIDSIKDRGTIFTIKLPN